MLLGKITVKGAAYAVKPTEDMAHLGERRKAMDLMPVSDYLCVIEASYGPASRFKQ